MTTSPVFCALDTPDVTKARALALKIKDHVGGLKVGLEYFTANGISGTRAISELGLPLFLDLKLHDIPNTVRGAVRSLTALKPRFITLHAAGGRAMMQAAVEAAREGGTGMKVLAVTVLTSLDSGDMSEVGQDRDVAAQVERLAKLAQDCGVDGVVCSPAEVARLRGILAPDFILMVPGIRPSWAATGDQKRVMTPKEAMDQGATHLVIGRPITGASDPQEAAQRIATELAA